MSENEAVRGNDVIFDTTKRLPIVLCLDISPSMGANRRIQDLNRAVQRLYERLKADAKAPGCVEIAVVPFSSTVVGETDFEQLDSLHGKTFTTVSSGGTNLSTAVLTSIRKLDNRVVELNSHGVGTYLPFLILVTDGDPDHTDNPANLERAIAAVQGHCDGSGRNLIVPYIIGVGEQVTEEALDRFAEKFTGKAIIIDDMDRQDELFQELFTFIGNSVTNSITRKGDLKSLYNSLQKTATKQTVLIHSRRGQRLM